MSMTPAEVQSTMPTRWSYLSKVINNKKAIDVAFMKHQWEMQKSATDNAGAKERQEIASSGGKSSPENIAMAMAQKALADSGISADSPEYQANFYKAYTYFLNPTAPKPEVQDPAAMATGGMPQPAVNPTGQTEQLPTTAAPAGSIEGMMQQPPAAGSRFPNSIQSRMPLPGTAAPKEADIQFTMKKYGLTRAEVLRRLKKK